MSWANKIVIGLGMVIPSSRWKIWLYRRLGFRIGRHTRIRGGSFIYARKAVLGEGVVIEPRTRIVCDELILGDEAKIDSETTVYGRGRLEMARGAYIGPRAWINCEAPVSLGVNTGVGPRSAIYTHGVWLPYVDGFPRKFEPVILEDEVWVPGDVTILPGVRIGRGSMLGAGAVVTKDVPANSFAAGSPATVISSMDSVRRSLDAKEEAARVREILDGFLAALNERGVEITRGTGDSYAKGATHSWRNRAFGLVFAEGTVGSGMANRLVSDSRQGDLLVVAAGGIEDGAIGIFAQTKDIYWFDIHGRRCRSAWKGHAYDLRRYFASYFGVRFRLVA